MGLNLIVVFITSRILLLVLLLFQMLVYVLRGLILGLFFLFLPMMLFSGSQELGVAISFAFKWSVTISLYASIIPALIMSLKNMIKKENIFSNLFMHRINKKK